MQWETSKNSNLGREGLEAAPKRAVYEKVLCRYPNGETYPAWHEIDEMIFAMPPKTKLSFHFNESKECPYVSSLLQGEPEALRLVEHLCAEYRARHLQINISAFGVPQELFAGEKMEMSAKRIAQLAESRQGLFFFLSSLKGVMAWHPASV